MNHAATFRSSASIRLAGCVLATLVGTTLFGPTTSWIMPGLPGVTSQAHAFTTQLAGDIDPSIACDPVSNSYLIAFRKTAADGYSTRVYGKRMNSAGYQEGAEFAIADTASEGNLAIRGEVDVAYDSVNARYLVVWASDVSGVSSVLGRFVTPGGGAVGPVLAISTAPGGKFTPCVAFDAQNRRFLVTWTDGADIRGQLITAGGEPYGTGSAANFAVTSASGVQADPSIAFDTTNRRFLVVWTDSRSGTGIPDIRGQLISEDGTLFGTAVGTNFVIKMDGIVHRARPAVDYDAVSHHFLVVFERMETPARLCVQSLAESGATNGGEKQLSTGGAASESSVACGGGEIWAAWIAEQSPGGIVVNRQINGDGTALSSERNWLGSLDGLRRLNVVYSPRGKFVGGCEVSSAAPSILLGVPMAPGIDTFPPITSLYIDAPQQPNGWYANTGELMLLVDDGTPKWTFFAWNTPGTPTALFDSTSDAPLGVNTMYYYSVDGMNNTESVKATTIKVDNVKPATTAPSKSTIRRRRKGRLYFRVDDPYTDNRTYVKLVIKKGRSTKKTLNLGLVKANQKTYASYTPRLAKGTYRFYVYATDQAGNIQANVASNKLIVK